MSTATTRSFFNVKAGGRLGQNLRGGVSVASDQSSGSLAILDRALEEELLTRELEPVLVPEPKPQIVLGPNGKLATRNILRQVRMQSVGNWIQAQTVTKLAELEKVLIQELREADPATNGTSRLFAIARLKVSEAFGQLANIILGHLLTMAHLAADQGRFLLAQHHGVTSAPKLERIEEAQVWGAPLHEHFEKIGSDTFFKFKALIRSGLQAGDSLDQLARRIEGLDEPVQACDCATHGVVHAATAAERAKEFAKQAAKKRMLVHLRMMDGVENSINKVIQAAITAFGNEIETRLMEGSQTEKRLGYKWLAVLDARTCDFCEFHDGKVWDRDYEPIGEDGVAYPGDPPAHPNCRCSIIPVDLDEEEQAVQEGRPPAMPKDIDEYLAQFSRSEQEAAFGKENLRAYHRGDLTAGQLIGQGDNLLTLEQFKEALP